MSGTRVYEKMGKKAGRGKPAVRVGFTGKWVPDYYGLRDVAEGDFNVKQTTLCRMILSEWLKDYRNKKGKGGAVWAQTVMFPVTIPPKKKRDDKE